MFKAVFLLSCLWCSLLVSGQKLIKGRVVISTTGTPIQGASVFIANTSKGTTTGSNGEFELINVPAGKHELIISSIGYETNVFSFTDEQLPLQLRIEMEVKAKEMENVVLEPFVEEDWDKWGKVFTENFAGTTPNAAQLTIRNKNVLKFRHYKKSNRIVAYADEPLILENRALGYMISYQLEGFEVNFKDKSAMYYGYSLFTEMAKQGKEPKSKWMRNRLKVYQGSMMHFMRSIYSNELAQEGFQVRRMKKVPNVEKQRVKKIYANSVIKREFRDGKIYVSNAAKDTTLPNDSITYYQRVLRQPDQIEVYAKELLTADSLIVAAFGSNKAVSFNDYLYIRYDGDEDPAYAQTQFPPRRVAKQQSYIFLVDANEILIDATGNYYNPQNLYSTAYWGWSEKMANSLPLDYMPGR
jgi:hypothetical protein